VTESVSGLTEWWRDTREPAG